MLTLHSTRESHGKDVFARMQRARAQERRNAMRVSSLALYANIVWYEIIQRARERTYAITARKCVTSRPRASRYGTDVM